MQPLTADDLLTMPDGDRYELIDGELKELHRGQESSWVAGQIHYRIGAFLEDRELDWVFPEGVGYQCFPKRPRTIRRADVSFMSRGRLPEGPASVAYTLIPPDLAVEVLSPRDLLYDLEEKIADYLEAGVRIVWVANPHQRTVTIHRLSDPSSPTRLMESDELRGEEALEGFRCRVGDLFPPRGAETGRARLGTAEQREST